MTTILLDPDYLEIPVRSGFKIKIFANGQEIWVEYVYFRRETHEEWCKRTGRPPPRVLTPEEEAIAERLRKEMAEALKRLKPRKAEISMIKQTILEVKPMELPSGFLFLLDYSRGKNNT